MSENILQPILFGVSSIPLSTQNPNYINGLKQLFALDLDAFELPFTQFVNMSEQTAHMFYDELEKHKQETGKEIKISVHAPYFINLNAAEEKKIHESIQRILTSAKRGSIAGATTIVFHPGFYLKDSPEVTYEHMKASIRMMLSLYKEMDGMVIRPMLRPETTGKVNQFGTLQELIDLSKEFEEILPCIDFAHLHARSNGAVNTYQEIAAILDDIHTQLGDRLLHNLHVHYSGIEYNQTGERKHLPLQDSDSNYTDLLRALKDKQAIGTIICESPAQEEDALLLKKTFMSL